jgi:hypothetical protein
MLAWETARQWQAENCMTPFEELLGAHLSCGLVHSTKDCFLLAQEVIWDPELKAIVESRESKDEGQQCQQPNAWFVTLAASGTQVSGLRSQVSPIREFLRVATHPHPYVLWYRAARNRPHNLHSYKWDHLARRVKLETGNLKLE